MRRPFVVSKFLCPYGDSSFSTSNVRPSTATIRTFPPASTGSGQRAENTWPDTRTLPPPGPRGDSAVPVRPGRLSVPRVHGRSPGGAQRL